MSEQRGTSAVAAAHRSIHPGIPGVPSWTALLIAVTATAIGYGIDSGSGHKELTGIFAALYVAGCVVAVLAVRQEGLFTAVIQPPLILFCAVPGAYWLFHGGKIGSVKDLLINCGYPLIERFPLMLGAAGGVLLIGLIRWYLGTSQRPTAGEAAEDRTDTPAANVAEKSPFLRAVSAKLNSLLGVASSDGATDEEEPIDAQRRSTKASARTSRTERSGRSAASPARSRSRHARPSPQEEYDPADERPRRRRQTPPRDYDPADPPRRSSRRRPRPQGDPDPRGQSQREGRRDPRSRRNPYERPATRGSRYEDYDRYDPSEPLRRYQSYEPYESYQPVSEARRGHAAASGTNGANPSHHPISQVRYRGSGKSDERRGEPRGDRRGRPRSNGRPPERPPAESWEYDA
ncbi:DUF6542 domain-containing protein [Mycobacterium lentiflavum]|uniref:DUF6542 domain-containing protein n=1 Tax=Mycobacterium lentiflavum TaxID=141349 RepID=UPI000B82C435|nr:DUF6542 domain-containing protein [Mycobacterium lentiflavum]